MFTDNSPAILEKLQKSIIVPVFYHDDPDTCMAVMSVCFEEGVEAFEYTNRGPQALKNFAVLQSMQKERFPQKSLGIGTVKTAEEAGPFLSARPAFLVSPLLNKAVGSLCLGNGVPWLPGCMTPTEIFEASSHGAAVIKIFPANAYGPSFIRGVKAVFPEVHFMPTGGIRAEKTSLKDWFDAGVCCVGMGSELLDKDLIRGRDWEALRRKIRGARELALSCIG